MRTWPRVRWYPSRRAKIRLADIGAGDRTEIYLGECPSCGGLGAFAVLEQMLDPGRPAFVYRECRRCAGSGVCERSTYFVAPDRPRSRFRMIVRWRDPATGWVHARLWPSSKRGKRRDHVVAACPAMRLRRARYREFVLDEPITCEACQLAVERSLLAAAGVPPLPEREDLLVDP